MVFWIFSNLLSKTVANRIIMKNKQKTIPKGWTRYTLGDKVEFLRGFGLSKDKIVEGGINKCILYGELYTKYNEVVGEVQSRTNSFEGTKSKKGDVILPSSTTTKGIDLANAVAINEDNILLGGDIIIIRDKSNIFNSNYFAHYLTHILKKDIEKLTQGTTIIHLYGNSLKNLEVTLPPLKEQQKIAEILSVVDEDIEKTDEIIKKTEELKKGLMEELFTKGIGHKKFKNTELGAVPEEWKVEELKNVSTKIGDGLHGTPEYSDGSEFYFINGNNIFEREIKIYSETKRISVEEYQFHKKELTNRSVLLSINGTIGNIGFYNGEKVVLGKSVAYINCDIKINKEFIAYQLETERIQKYFTRELTGTTIKNLSLGTIRRTLIFVPSDKEQRKIKSILLEVDNKIQINKKLKNKLTELKKGLMRDLLSGKKYEFI